MTEEVEREAKDEDVSESPAYIQYLRERDEAREQLQIRDKELKHSRSNRYELSKKCEDLEDQVRYLKAKLKQLRTQAAAESHNNHISFRKPPPKLMPKPVKKTRDEKASKQPKKPTLHPIIPNKEETADDSLGFYAAVSQLCPDAKLSVIINAEKLFLEGDVNGDGLIDAEELDNLFTKHLALYTRQQTEEILATIDTDGSGTLDFIEILQVMHEMDQGATNKLSEKPLQKDSKGTVICSVQ